MAASVTSELCPLPPMQTCLTVSLHPAIDTAAARMKIRKNTAAQVVSYHDKIAASNGVSS
jgi:hypothetical protein